MSDPPGHPDLRRDLMWRDLSAELFGDRPPPLRIGHHRIESVIGEGATGIVYAAWDEQLERPVALKVLAAHLPGDEHERMLAEGRALARVRHPGVVPVHAVERRHGRTWIVMALVEGCSLETWQAAAERDDGERLAAYVQAGRALQAVHDRGLVHRDFKPHNVKIDARGRVYVLDFGFALAQGEGGGGGTFDYAAPEQLAGGVVDARGDQFAFCVALYEALAGVLPFVGTDRHRRQIAIEAGELQRPRRSSSVSAELLEVLRRGMRARAEHRWVSMEALLDAIEAASVPDGASRDRARLLARVEQFWLRGVLEPSLAGTGAFDVPIELESPDAPREHEGERTGRVVQLDELDALGRLAIVGIAGSGKTILALRLLRIAATRARMHSGEAVPLMLRIDGWDPGQVDLQAWLATAIGRVYGLSRGRARQWLGDGELALFLDGLDELSPGAQPEFLRALGELCRQSSLHIVLTSRPGAVADNVPATMAIARMVALPETRVTSVAGPVIAEAARTVAGPSGVTPLMLGLMLRSASSDEGRGTTMRVSGTNESTLWRGVIDHGLEHARLRAFGSRAEIRSRLAIIAEHLRTHHRGELSIDELQAQWLPPGWRRRAQSMVPAGLSGLGGALGSGLCLAPALGGAAALWLAGGTWLLCAAFIARVVGIRTIVPVDELTWSGAQLRRGIGSALARAAGWSGLVAGLAAGLWTFAAGPAIALAMFVTQYGLWFCVLALTFGLLAGLVPRAIARRPRPGHGIRRSWQNMGLVAGTVAMAVGILLGFIVLVSPTTAIPPELLSSPDASETSLLLTMTAAWRDQPQQFVAAHLATIVVSVAYVAGMCRGGFAVIQHFVLRGLLATGGILPWRLREFLELVVDAGLMRQVGGAFMFAHSTLRDELSTFGPEDGRDQSASGRES